MIEVRVVREAIRKPHGELLRRRLRSMPSLREVEEAYSEFVEAASDLVLTDKAAVYALTESFNTYRRKTIYIFEGGKNVPQENLRSTMMEEFLSWLFKDVFVALEFEQPKNFKIGKSNSTYLELTFSPKSFKDLFDHPNPCILRKDQDFVLGAFVSLAISGASKEESDLQRIVLPVVAIECKTYLAKNHLDMCSSTAASLKRAMPYCMYIIVGEFLKMDKAVVPEYTDISEIFILCKAKNSERSIRRNAGLPPHDIDSDLVWQLYQLVLGHLRAIWWDPQTAVERGRIINRP